MKLTFIGTGSAFTVGSDNYHSNMLLENDAHQKLLIDCGSDARLALHDVGLSHDDIDHVYISHLHADHVGGLEWLAFSRKFGSEKAKPAIYIEQSHLNKLWPHVLSGGLSTLQGEEAKLSTFFDVKAIQNEDPFEWQNLKIKVVKTCHAMSNSEEVPSYGLFFKANGNQVYITTDTRFCPEKVDEYYQKADIIFQDCETATRKSGVHAHYEQLVTLPTAIKNKMWLYHYNPGKLPDAKKDGFRGFVKRRQVFDFAKPETLK